MTLVDCHNFSCLFAQGNPTRGPAGSDLGAGRGLDT